MFSTCGKSSFPWLLNLGLHVTCCVYYVNTLIKLRGMWCGEDSWIKCIFKYHAGVYLSAISYSADAVKLCKCV